MIEEIKIDRLEELIHEMMIKIRNTSVTNSAEGNPIEIENAAAAPLLNCVSAITGSQDLNGYDKPWVGGAGKNKLRYPYVNTSSTISGITFTDNGDGTLTANGTAAAKIVFYIQTAASNFDPPMGQYIFTKGFAYDNDTDVSIILEAYNGTSYIKRLAKSSGADAVTCNIDYDGFDRIEIYLAINEGITVSNLLFKPMLRLATVSDATFAPYSNICPITAFSTGSVKVEDEDEQSTTYAATFTDPIYQGSIDYAAKKTTATWGYIASYDGETLPGRWISDRDEYAPGTTPTTGAEVAYELESAAVETVTVSNAPVSAVHGYNKIESSTGDMEVTYITEDFEPLVPTT
jgi:hypothetical protein